MPALPDEPNTDMGLKDWIAQYLPGGAGKPAARIAARWDPTLRWRRCWWRCCGRIMTLAPAERQQVMASVSALLGLGPEETQALVEEAERHIDKSHDLYQFTSQINRTFSEAEKVRLLEALWRVADADLTVHKYEEHLIRRVADLLHVPHSGFIAAKLRATGVTTATDASRRPKHFLHVGLRPDPAVGYGRGRNHRPLAMEQSPLPPCVKSSS